MAMPAQDGATTAISVAQKVVQPPAKSGLPDWDAAHLRLAIEAAGVALWSWNVDTNRFTMDERAFELWGVPLSDYVSFEDLSVNIHPADRDRVKNLLAIATGLTAITSRSAKTTADMAQELTHRLTALGRAHDLVRPLPGQSGKAALLGDLFTVLLAPYDDMGAFSGRVRVSVPRMGVGEQAATTLALVVHELATNSLKYGALSSQEGVLDISCVPHDTEVTVVWTERGGPPVQALTGDGGYGSKLLNRGMTVQLGGSISCDWNPEGVIVTLKMTKDRLTR